MDKKLSRVVKGRAGVPDSEAAPDAGHARGAGHARIEKMTGFPNGNPRKSGCSLADLAYEKIIAAVIDRRFPVNTRLPSENSLAAELGISRPVLRTALNRLKTDGVIASRRGSGNYVIRQPHQTVLQLSAPTSIADVQNSFKFRIGIEGEGTFHAALTWDSEQKLAIEDALSELQEAHKGREYCFREDFNFHIKIAEASNNPYFVSALKAVQEQTMFAIGINRQLSIRRSNERLLEVDIEHKEICKRLFARDGNGAREAMREHLESARRRLFESDII